MAVWGEVIATLERSVAAIQQEQENGRPVGLAFGPHPGRSGADWLPREQASLTKGFKGGMAVAALALAHQRSTGAVEAQLVKLGLMAYADCQYSGPRRNF